MANDAAAVLGDEHVERVAGLHVDEVRPRAEDLQRAQLAAMLVRDDVVGIVGARAVIAEPAERPPGQPRARRRRDTSRPGCDARGAAPPRDRSIFIRRALAGRRRDLAPVPDRELIGPDVNEMVLDLPVSERPEDLVGDEDCAGRGFGIALRVERDEPGLALAHPAS